MESLIAAATATEATATPPAPECSEQQKIAEAIARLMEVNLQAKRVARRTDEELNAARQKAREQRRQVRCSRIIASVLTRLHRRFTTPDDAYAFVLALVADTGLTREKNASGVMVFDPAVAEALSAAPAQPHAAQPVAAAAASAAAAA